MGRNSKYKNTRAVATAQSFQSELLNNSSDIEKDNKLWNTINKTRDDILEKYQDVLSDPKNYFPKYDNYGFSAIDNIRKKKPDFIRKNKDIDNVLNLLEKTKFGKLQENTDFYAQQLDFQIYKLSKLITDNPSREFIRVPHWHINFSNNPEYKKFYRGTKDVGDRIIKYANKRFSLLSPEDQAIKDIYLLASMHRVMIDSINELNKSPLPWNRSYKYNHNQVIDEKNFTKQSELIGADSKVFNYLKFPQSSIYTIHNNAKNAILSEINTQRKISKITNNATRKRVDDYAESFDNAKINSEKDLKDYLDVVSLYSEKSVDDE